MTPDLNHSISVHNAGMKLWWKDPEYIRERKAFVKRNPVCIRCGRPTQTPGHSHEDYRDFKTYLAAVVQDKCDPLCNRCNGAERKGKKPCPECVKQKKDPIRYIPQDQEICFDCLPPEGKEAHQKRAREFRKFIRGLRDADNARRRAAYQARKHGVTA